MDTSSIGILGDDSAEQEAVAELEAAEAAAAARAAKKGALRMRGILSFHITNK